MSEPAEEREPAPQPEPLDQRGKVAAGMLAVVGLAAAGSLWADAGQLDVMTRIADGEDVTLKESSDSDERVSATALIYTVAYIVSVITFLLWQARAFRNAKALGAEDQRYRPRWAIAYWFIPIVNLFRPLQVINDLWRSSDPDLPRSAAGWHDVRVPALLGLWWAAWLLSSLISNFAVRGSFDSGAAATPQDLKDEAAAYVAADIADIAAAILAVIVVRRITRRMEERRTRLQSGRLPDPETA